MKLTLLLGILLLSGLVFSEEIQEDSKVNTPQVNNESKSDSQSGSEDAIKKESAEETAEDIESDTEEEDTEDETLENEPNDDDEQQERNKDSEVEDPKLIKRYRKCKALELIPDLFFCALYFLCHVFQWRRLGNTLG